MARDSAIKSTVVIPNYNGIAYIKNCLDSLLKEQEEKAFHVIVVDNHSTDGSKEQVALEYPNVKLIAFEENTGFCKAVNAGIEASDTEYVILLNNDTTVEKGFVLELEKVMEGYPMAFSAGAKMVDMKNRLRRYGHFKHANIDIFRQEEHKRIAIRNSFDRSYIDIVFRKQEAALTIFICSSPHVMPKAEATLQEQLRPSNGLPLSIHKGKNC